MQLLAVLLHVLLYTLFCTPAFASPNPSPEPGVGVDPATVAHLPYQYFHSDGVGGSNAACWLSRVPFATIDGLQCRFADSISQLKNRQIWQCDGDQRLFCDACHQLETHLSDPKELVSWKVQGC